MLGRDPRRVVTLPRFARRHAIRVRYAVTMKSPRFVVAFAIIASCATRDARAQEPVRLRVGTLAIEGSRYMKDIRALGREIEKRTRGGVRLDWVPNGRLGDEQTMVDLIVRGELDGGGFSETGLVAAVPDMAVWRSPGLFRSYDEVDRATAALEPTVRELFTKRDLVFTMWADLGFAHVFANEPVKGLRELLAMASPWITMSLDPKLVEAVASGRARAWALPPLYMFAIQAKARSMSRLRYRYVVGALVVSRPAWSRMTSAQQTTFLEVCRAWQPRLRKSWRRETERAITTLEKTGVRMQATPDAELATFFEAASKTRTARARTSGRATLMAKVVAAIATK